MVLGSNSHNKFVYIDTIVCRAQDQIILSRVKRTDGWFRLCSIRGHFFSNRHHHYLEVRLFTSITRKIFQQIPLDDKLPIDGPGLLASRDQRAQRHLVRASRQGISVLRVHRRPSGSNEPTGVLRYSSTNFQNTVAGGGARNITILHLVVPGSPLL